MSEALLKPVPERLRQLGEPLDEFRSVLTVLEVNDNELSVPPTEGEQRMFELPKSVWGTMVACYAVFLTALLAATGGSRASMAIVISTVYVIMFFGTARVMLRQAPPQAPSPLDRSGAVLQTAFGPLARREVFGQVLIVPLAVASFGVAIAVISAIVM